MTIRTSDTDRGEKRIRKSLKNLDGKQVVIGINEGAGEYPNGVAIALVGFWHEYGTSNMPARSFIRAAIDKNIKTIESRRAKLLGDVLVGRMSETLALEQLGFMISEMIKTYINQMLRPRLAPSTVAAKARAGFAPPEKPLIATRTLVRSITYKVDK